MIHLLVRTAAAIDYEARTANATVALAIITAILAVGTAILAAFTYKLWRSTADMVQNADAASKKQSEDMRASVDAMIKIGEAVELSASLSKLAVEGIQEQLALGHRHLVANNPPVIDVRYVEVPEDTNELVLSFEVANVGTTPAKLIQVAAANEWIGLGRELPMRPPYVEVVDPDKDVFMVPGSRRTFGHPYTGEPTAYYGITNNGPMLSKATLLFFVEVRFEDENGVLREQEFRFGYDRASGRFLRSAP